MATLFKGKEGIPIVSDYFAAYDSNRFWQLDDMDLHVRQIREAAVADAEIIKRDPDSHLSEGCKHGDYFTCILPEGTRASELLAAARADDPVATRLLTRWATPLRCAMETLIAAIDPDLIVLGGGLGETAFAALDHAPFKSAWFQCPVRAAVLGDDAGIIGAGLCALEYRVDQPEKAAQC